MPANSRWDLIRRLRVKYAPNNGQCPQHKEFNFATVTEYEMCKYEDAEQVNGMAVTPKFS